MKILLIALLALIAGDVQGQEKKCRVYFGNEYEQYIQLSERGKYIVDSLKDHGIASLDRNYLSLEPIYMRRGSKKEWLWQINDDKVVMYQYLFYHYDRSSGIRLLKEKNIE